MVVAAARARRRTTKAAMRKGRWFLHIATYLLGSNHLWFFCLRRRKPLGLPV
jgi:hypothetical protein